MRKPQLSRTTRLGIAFVASLILIGVGIEAGVLVRTGIILVDILFVDIPAIENHLSDVEKIKDVAATAQSAVTVIAIVVGGGYALFKLDAFRDLKPHVNIVHEISHRIMNDTYVHISVTAILHNGSKVEVELLESRFTIQRILPMSNETIEEKYDQVFYDKEEEHLQWPTLDILELRWGAGELVIEPGEVHRETQEFLVKLEEAETVLIYTHFPNSKNEGFGWHATTVHDIVSE